MNDVLMILYFGEVTRNLKYRVTVACQNVFFCKLFLILTVFSQLGLKTTYLL